MKFIVSSTTLLKNLQQLNSILNSSNVLPILDNFLFELKNGELTVTASDLETTMNTKVAVKADSDGIIAIPAKMLFDIVKSFPELPLSFTADLNNYAIEISAGDGKYNIAGFDGSEYPKLQELTDGNKVAIHSQVLATGINKTIFATGNDDMRPQMNGVFMQFSPQGTTFVATDAHKLVKYQRSDIVSEAEIGIILPKKPLNFLKNNLGNIDENVHVTFNETAIFFSYGDIKIVSRLVEGKYPNYEAVIPTQNPNKMTISKSSFINSVRRVALFANKSTYQIRLKIAGSELTISAEDFDYNNAANERLTCQYIGEDIEIGFNAKFLGDLLNNIESENVILELSASNRAGILLEDNAAETNENLLMLIMPIMLNS